jgi:hypothetical protein
MDRVSSSRICRREGPSLLWKKAKGASVLVYRKGMADAEAGAIAYTWDIHEHVFA